MQTVILAGGKCTRMGGLCKETPKPLLHVFGRPILFHTLDRLTANNLKDVLILVTQDNEDAIKAAVASETFPLRIRFHRDLGLGTAQALESVASQLTDDFLLIYGDVIFDIDLGGLIFKHQAEQSDVTLVVHPNDHPFDSDLVQVASDGSVLAIYPKPHRTESLPCRNLAMSAISVMTPHVLPLLRADMHDLGSSFYSRVLSVLGKIAAYRTCDYIKDTGTPQRLQEVQRDFDKDNVRRRKRPAVFLDRDGTINTSTNPSGFVNSPDEFDLIPGAAEAINMFHRAGYLVVVVTNQGGIELGYETATDLERVHIKMDSDLAKSHAYVDGVYFCPHYKEPCTCRKPEIGMIRQSADDLNIDLFHSVVVGDRTCDLMLAKRAHLPGYMVHTGSAGKDGEFTIDPFGQGDDLFQVAKFITENHVA